MTYQMLLVDDEIHVIDGVKSDLDLENLGIGKLFTAMSMKKAQEIFNRENIDIMICDIEMPQGSGLELLSWVRENYPDTVAIFLTSHADFKYAKEAMQLGSLDYLLKPVLAEDLEHAIRNAQSVIDQKMENNRNRKSHQLWLKHHSFIIERFWLGLIRHSIPSHPVAIREQVERHQIPITEDLVFLPVLISVQRWNKTMNRRDEMILEYALHNAAEEMIIGSHGNGICFHLDRGMLLVILAAIRGNVKDLDEMSGECTRYIASCHRYFYCDLSCYVGQPVEAHEMADMVTMLKTRERNNVASVNQVFTCHETGASDQLVTLPVLSSISSLLKTGTKEAVIAEAEKILGGLVRSKEMNAEVLHQFYQNFVQTLYTFLNSKGVQAHQLFGDGESRRVSEQAGRSVVDMLAWVHHAVNKAMNQADEVKRTDTVVQFVKRYISLNMYQDLTRETIAEQVFLNPDYLSRIFKKETGHSISDYVLIEKIKHAKELLAETSVPVSSIASSLGYANFSHFSKIFKKYNGIGPAEYRSQLEVQKGD